MTATVACSKQLLAQSPGTPRGEKGPPPKADSVALAYESTARGASGGECAPFRSELDGSGAKNRVQAWSL